MDDLVHKAYEMFIPDSREPHYELLADCGKVFRDDEYRVAIHGYTTPCPTFPTCLACVANLAAYSR